MNQPFVAILMGSISDWNTMREAQQILQDLRIPCEVRVTSAHRTPDNTRDYVQDADARGCRVFIAGAGLAAHLAGAVAAQTLRPVIGVPMEGGPLNGQDALLSTVQMPAGIPVATVAIGKAGARNAAHLAAQILALADSDIDQRIRQQRRSAADKVAADNAELQQQLQSN